MCLRCGALSYLMSHCTIAMADLYPCVDVFGFQQRPSRMSWHRDCMRAVATGTVDWPPTHHPNTCDQRSALSPLTGTMPGMGLSQHLWSPSSTRSRSLRRTRANTLWQQHMGVTSATTAMSQSQFCCPKRQPHSKRRLLRCSST